jgi:carboxymethylenebutenolidase
MCHADDSRPPAPPRSGAYAPAEILTLAAPDGSRCAAAYAEPAAERGQPAIGVVVIPDVRGLHPYYVALAERFAEAGLPAVAFDFYGRTAGVPDGGLRAADFAWEPHRDATTPAGIDADTRAAIDYLRRRTRPDLPVITLGFCFGGSAAWRQATGELPITGSVGFYGRPGVVGDAADTARLPVMLIIAGDDFATPVDDQLALAERMRSAGADVESHVYDGAPHSFFDRSFAEWQDACADVWVRVLDFADRVSR